MLPMFGILPNSGDADVQIFTNPATVTNTQWQTWVKPRGKSMAQILCAGGGGGGGGGFTAAAAAARGGGGGGGGSGLSKLTVPLFFLPDILYVQVGAGGAGVGSGGGTAGSGIHSYVGIYPDITASNILNISSATAPTGGGTGTGAAVGALGAGGTIPTIATMPLAGLGTYVLIAGAPGVAGAAVAGAAGTNTIIPVTGTITMGGGGGAGTTSADFAGSSVTAITGSLLSTWRPTAAAAGSNNGPGGFLQYKPLFSWSGMGGASSNAGVGGGGGFGGPAAGGGGGGGGTTGGIGGNGGPGLIMIICW